MPHRLVFIGLFSLEDGIVDTIDVLFGDGSNLIGELLLREFIIRYDRTKDAPRRCRHETPMMLEG